MHKRFHLETEMRQIRVDLSGPVDGYYTLNHVDSALQPAVHTARFRNEATALVEYTQRLRMYDLFFKDILS